MEKNKKFIDKIEPFNEYFLGSCFTHALISILSLHFPREQLLLCHALKNLFTMNECFYFEPYNSGENRLIDDKSVADIVKHKFEEKAVIEKINNGIPVIAGLDCFYLDIRPDTYKKRHELHYLAIYGYDEDRQIYNIIEHSYVNGYDFVKREASMKTIKKSASYFEKNYSDNKKAVIEIKIINGWHTYYFGVIKNFLDKKKDIVNLININLNYLKQIIEKGYYYVTALSDIITKFFQRLRMIVFCILKLSRKLKKEKLIEICEECITLLTFFSGAIARISFAKDISFFKYRKEDFYIRLNKYYELQRILLNAMIEDELW